MNDDKKKQMEKPELKKSLSQLMDEFNLEDSDEDKFETEDVEQAKAVTKDLNLMKLTSSQLLEEAIKREDDILAGGDGSDKYIPMN